MAFRRGLVEVSESDMEVIAEAMSVTAFDGAQSDTESRARLRINQTCPRLLIPAFGRLFGNLAAQM